MGLLERLFGKRKGAEAPQRRVPRTPENVPSIVLAPVTAGADYRQAVQVIMNKSPDKELVCLVEWGWTASTEEADALIQLVWEFADDPKLAVMRFPKGDQIIARAVFLRAIAPEVGARTMPELAEQLARLARSRGFHVREAG